MIGATAIAISLTSYHFNREVKHNEVNPGVFVELNDAYVIGVYRNSNFRTTVLAARQWEIGRAGDFSLGVLAGVCSGYRSPVCGSLTVGMGNVRLTFVPPVGREGSAVVGFAWRQPL